jgi:hypothetical protein
MLTEPARLGDLRLRDHPFRSRERPLCHLTAMINQEGLEYPKGNNSLQTGDQDIDSKLGCRIRMCTREKGCLLARMLLPAGSLRGFGLSGGGGAVSSLPRSRSRTVVQISRLAQP